uniref:Globin domain-containing protein n=1 Tax=Candidozyma auris TaxID=498019 RepID=A0A0L0P5X3_CANAR
MIADSTTRNLRKPARFSQLGNINVVRKHILLRVDSFTSDVSLLGGTTLNELRNEDDSYNLKKVGTNTSLDSNLTVQSKFKVQFHLLPKEISLLRYTWNKMLVDEELETQELSLPIEGLLTVQQEKHHLQPQSRQQAATILSSRYASMALSMFCISFYHTLLSMDPELELMFPSLRHQASAFASVISLAISSLENLSVLDDYLTKLGNTHSRILGIEAPQFELMGEAFIQTFHERFGTKFTHELEVLWIKLYMYLANSLLQNGMDPTLKLDSQVFLRPGVYTESIYADSDSSSLSLRAKTESTTLDLASAFSVRLEKPRPRPLVAKPKKEKKKRDCVIV